MNFYNTDYLEHHGILGQKWGVRRYQNPDGTLTSEGKKRQQKEFASRVAKRHSYSKYPKHDFNLANEIKEAASPEKLEKMLKANYKYVQTLDGRYYSKEKNLDAWNNYTKVRNEIVDDIVGKYGSKKIRYIKSRYNTTVEELMRVNV